jgi:hypothetical protein
MNNRQWVNSFFIGALLLVISLLILSFFLHDKFQKNTLEKKEYLIKENTPKIIFAGDSRASVQLSVSTALDILKYDKGDIVNIAVDSGDPIAINYLVDKYPDKFKNSTVLVSMSANQLNDNAKSKHHFTYSMISKMSYKEKIITFVPNNIPNLFGYYLSPVKSYLKTQLNLTKKNLYEETYGFIPLSGTLQAKKITDRKIKNHPWYKNYISGGLKYKIIDNSLSSLANKVGRLYVYTAPFAPSYLAAMKEGRILNFEKSFKTQITNICNKHNITCIHYLKIDELNDSHFSDGVHTNKLGAKIFTRKVLRDFRLAPIQ